MTDKYLEWRWVDSLECIIDGREAVRAVPPRFPFNLVSNNNVDCNSHPHSFLHTKTIALECCRSTVDAKIVYEQASDLFHRAWVSYRIPTHQWGGRSASRVP